MENNQETPVTDVTPMTEVPEALKPPKQYLLMVNEISMIMLSKMLNGIQFLEVEGMPIKENENVMVMVTPVLPVATSDASNCAQNGPESTNV